MESNGSQPLRCSKKNCKSGETAVGLTCMKPKCTVVVCAMCSAGIIAKHHLTPLPSPSNVVCTKTCYNAISKFLANDGLRKTWDADTPDLSFERSLEAWILEWICKLGNYSRWKDNKNGISKINIQKNIANALNEHGLSMGIDRQRTEKQVGNKIEYYQSRFKETFDWIHGTTGQGLLEEHGLVSFQELVKGKFKWYYELLPIISVMCRTYQIQGPIRHFAIAIPKKFCSQQRTTRPLGILP